MKYFTEKFFDLDKNRGGDEFRSKLSKQYWDEFDSCAYRLPKSFVRYYKQHGFHDDILEKMEIVKRRTKRDTELDIITQFRSGKQLYEIRYDDVIKFETSLDLRQYCEIGDYLNGEILPVNDDYMSHEFGFFNYPNKIIIHFRRLKFREIWETPEQQDASFAAIYPNSKKDS